MRFSCDSCQARYTVADERLRSGTHRVRCKRCGHAIVLQASASVPESMAAELTADRPMWFAAIGKQEIGPLTIAQLQERLKKGLVSVRTYVWRDGLANWTRLRDIPLLASLVPTECLDGSAPPSRKARRILVASAAGIAIIALAALAWLRFGTTSEHGSGGAPVASSGSP